MIEKLIVSLIFGLVFFIQAPGQSKASSPTDAFTPASMAPGSPAGSYSISDLESINNYNGNLSFNIPLIPVGGRGDIGFSKTLVIENHWQLREWRYWQGSGTSSWSNPTFKPESTYTGIPGMPKPGEVGILYGRRSRDKTPSPTVGSDWSYTGITQLTFVGLDGSETSLRDVLTDGVPQKCIQAVNASGGFSRGTVFTDRISNSMTFISDAPIRDLACGDTSFAVMNGLEILRPSGTLYLHAIGAKVIIIDGNVSQIVDRHGNLSYGGGSSTDILGRPVGYDNIKGFGGVPKEIQVIRRPLGESLRSGFTLKTYGELFPGQPMLQSDASTIYDPEVIAEVLLPNAKGYKFKYSSYGQLSEVEIPTGGRVEYDWQFSINDLKIVKMKLTERREYISQSATQWENKTVYSSGGTTEFCQYSIPCNTVAFVSKYIRDIDGTIKTLGSTKHYYYGNSDAQDSSWYPFPKVFDGREFKTEVYDESVNLYSINEKIWNSNSYSATYNSSVTNTWQSIIMPTHPFIQESKNTLIEGNKVSKTTFSYDSELRLTDTYEYNFGNQFVRRTHTDYVDDVNYVQKYLRQLPLRTWVSADLNGANKVSLQEFEYDNYNTDSNHAPLLSRNNVIRHDTTNYGPNVVVRGNVTSVQVFTDSQNPATGISSFSQYDILGNVVKVIDGKGNATTIDYTDRFGNPDGEARANISPTELGGLSTYAFPTSSTNPLGWVTGYSQVDYYTGQPVDKEDINGVVSSTFYNDPLNRPTQSISANNLSNFRRQSIIVYDDVNRKVTTTADLYSFGDSLIKGESFYDELGRVFESRKYEEGGYIATKTEYDGWSRARRTTNPFRPWKNETELWTESKFDSLGRLIEVKTPDNARVLTSYYGNTVTVSDQSGKQRRSLTDGLGNLIRVDEPTEAGGLGTTETPNQPTYYEYDILNCLTKVKQGGTLSQPEQTRVFVYDSLSRLKSAANPESGLIQFVYDNNSNLTKKTDARLVETDFVYDALNRVVLRSYANEPGGQTATPPVTYTYDNLPNAKGRLTKVANAYSTTEYTQFDNLGRLIKSRQTTDGTAYNEMEYTFNLSGALVEQKYPSGRVVKNVLDNDGRLSIVQSKKNANAGYWSYADSFTYTSAGAVSSMQLGNGKWESTQFNARFQPTQIALGKTPNATNLLQLDFVYSTTQNNGNIQTQTITVPTTGVAAGFTAIQSYDYDLLNRLKSAQEQIGGSISWKQTYTFDRYGNRRFDEANTDTLASGCATAVCNPTVDPATNKLIGYVFDSSGNTTTDAQNRTFFYDGENKQTLVKDASGQRIGEYFYDGAGKRVWKIEFENDQPTQKTIFVYDVSGKMIAEYATAVAPANQARISYLTNDHLGSPRITTDKDGNVFSRRDFMPYGEELNSTHSSQRNINLNYGEDGVRQKFTGYEKDSETGLDFAQARYFHNGSGRFTSPDFFANDTHTSDPQSWNLFVYVRNNPLKYIDSSGQKLTVSINGTAYEYTINEGKTSLVDSNNNTYTGGGKVEHALIGFVDRLISNDGTTERAIYNLIESGDHHININLTEGLPPENGGSTVYDPLDKTRTTTNVKINLDEYETEAFIDIGTELLTANWLTDNSALTGGDYNQQTYSENDYRAARANFQAMLRGLPQPFIRDLRESGRSVLEPRTTTAQPPPRPPRDSPDGLPLPLADGSTTVPPPPIIRDKKP